jgi:hypothetical protein
MQSSPFQQPVIIQEQRSGSNCSKPLVACLLAPVVLVACMALCGFACVAVVATGGPEPLDSNFTPDRTQAQRYENTVSTALSSAINSGSGTFTLAMRDNEFASWLNYRYREVLAENNEDSNVSNLDIEWQAQFDNGQVSIYGSTKVLFFTIASVITMEIIPSQTANLIEVDVVKFKLGRFDVQGSGQGDLEDSLAQALTDEIRKYAEANGIGRIAIQNVTAQGGVLTFTGTITR